MQSFTPRERTEEAERRSLSARASLAAETKGRDRYEEPDHLRTVYQQDRERILASRAFQRLAGTSAGLPLPGAGTLLGRTQAVAQASRALARGLSLNEDLSEAIALGHNLGQPPFGRAGHVALAGVAAVEFQPGEQALRVVERSGADGLGLNLTFETRDGIVHQAASDAATVEGHLVASVGTFCALSQELEQAVAAGVVRTADIPTAVRMLGSNEAQRLHAFMDDVLTASEVQPRPFGSPWLGSACQELAGWTAERVDTHPAVLAGAERVVHCLRSIAVYHVEKAQSSPAAVIDLICALTDGGARKTFGELFLPGPQQR